MKRVLLISYVFPPIQSAESTMALNSSKYLSELGWSTTVLCAEGSKKDSKDFSFLSEIPDDLSIYRTYSLEHLVLDVLSLLKFLPDSKIGWMPFALKKGKNILHKEKIDVIVSRSAPITSHIVALKLKSVAKVPWIACFSDPWTQNPYTYYPSKFLKKRDEHLEKKVVSTADRIVFTSKYAKIQFLEKYKVIPDDAVMVIPNSCDPSEISRTEMGKKSKFSITHAGNFYGVRSPEPILKALKLLKEEESINGKIEIDLIGYIGNFKHLISKYGLNDVIHVINTMPRRDVFSRLFNSDVLLLINAPAIGDKPSVFLPSKLVEYFFIGKPILAITPEGASADAVRATKTGVVVSPDDIEGIKNALRGLYNMYLNSNFKLNPDWDEINKYSAERCSELLVKAMEEVTQK